ncbi:MAG: type II toxin-antitoxin system VapC family toxin [Bacteroidetes bacterium]|nr:type II toxin-antitoxin system VapC family toxin [Bacteroidota bacterium]MBU1718465.1 type II toxin-antitoxin system VapC family toxin [Bacteroidota bacterium]
MAKRYCLVDTCVLIAVFRGNKEAKAFLDKLNDRIVISVITELELQKGAKTKERKKELSAQLKKYSKAVIDREICQQAVSLMNRYNSGNRDIFVADCLIAATALTNNIPLVTNNTDDFDFIEGLVLINPEKK